eukprot:CAMPEP_0178857406 /NCGR_PEP_ID=MMETSP0747-20121128/120_1 /TAXON_ID=913974 /ORGANISM="Nitzschia punctata, Strain CCMP561" /LENGTH=345 /DNA_ID=CAMNT_0020523645 /DNA_START=81 /DNA_END=1120 /DNA_ORIENTATION=+
MGSLGPYLKLPRDNNEDSCEVALVDTGERVNKPVSYIFSYDQAIQIMHGGAPRLFPYDPPPQSNFHHDGEQGIPFIPPPQAYDKWMVCGMNTHGHFMPQGKDDGDFGESDSEDGYYSDEETEQEVRYRSWLRRDWGVEPPPWIQLETETKSKSNNSKTSAGKSSKSKTAKRKATKSTTVKPAQKKKAQKPARKQMKKSATSSTSHNALLKELESTECKEQYFSPGLVVYAEFPENQQYYWGKIDSESECAQDGRKQWNILFHDGDTCVQTADKMYSIDEALRLKKGGYHVVHYLLAGNDCLCPSMSHNDLVAGMPLKNENLWPNNLNSHYGRLKNRDSYDLLLSE